MDPWDRELVWLRQVRDCARLFAGERDLRKLMAAVLDAAISITGAERGFLVRVLGRMPDGRPRLRVEEARGLDQADLERDASRVSRTVVSRVLEREDRGLVTTSGEDADVVNVSSVQARQTLSIACFPMRLRGEARGVLYLDHSQPGTFLESDLLVLETFASQAALAMETAELAAEPALAAPAPSPWVGDCAVSDSLRETVGRVARSWEPVLILGESGTGKELVARELHARGDRSQGPFVALNTAAVPEALLESELFGHLKGAFTGADEDQAGLFEQAAGGTLFLDEVGDMSLAMQGKLLRVLQERTFRPVGGGDTRPVSCRVLAATHKDLAQAVTDGEFRADLYYRLDVLRIAVPTLRARPDDIPSIVRHVLERLGATLTFSREADKLIQAYSWPGNVRQLENELRRLTVCCVDRVRPQDLSPEVREGRGVSGGPGATSGKTLAEVERAMLEAALETCEGNKSRAARQLGIPRSTLYDLIERYGLL